jgi:hypothetical protein
MKRLSLLLAVLLTVFIVLTACAAEKPHDSMITLDPKESAIVFDPEAAQSPATMPARPGSDVTEDPSANLPDLVEVSGIIKEDNQGLVLITLSDGSDFMLRFSENSKWAQGVSKEMKPGNTITCTVKPEPTFTTPSQGEVFEVTANEAAK